MPGFPVITVGLSTVRTGGKLVDINELKPMYEAGYNLVIQAADWSSQSNKNAWFGAGGVKSSGAIDTSSKKMRDYMNGGLKKLRFSCTGEAGSLASFNQYAHLKVPGGPPPDKLNKASSIMLDMGFHMDRYSWGERVGAILHEITHMCLGTADVKFEGVEMYGAVNCEKLAKQAPDLALTNAENWCYYFTSYHASTINRGRDWSYLTPEECKARGPLVV